MTNALVKPAPYEVVTGWGPECRVIYAHSLSEAEREYRRLVKAGAQPTLFLGEFCLRHAGEKAAAA